MICKGGLTPSLFNCQVTKSDHRQYKSGPVCVVSWCTSVRIIDEVSQLSMVCRLLVDDSVGDPCWMFDWVYSELDEADQELLEDLENRFQSAVAQPGYTKTSSSLWKKGRELDATFPFGSVNLED